MSEVYSFVLICTNMREVSTVVGELSQSHTLQNNIRYYFVVVNKTSEECQNGKIQ
jgi:hypothetical protein